MNLRRAYQGGKRTMMLRKMQREYDAWPIGLTLFGGPEVNSTAEDINRMTEQVREEAGQRADYLEAIYLDSFPRDISVLIGRLFFEIGYSIGTEMMPISLFTSEGPTNPFTGKTLYQSSDSGFNW